MKITKYAGDLMKHALRSGRQGGGGEGGGAGGGEWAITPCTDYLQHPAGYRGRNTV